MNFQVQTGYEYSLEEEEETFEQINDFRNDTDKNQLHDGLLPLHKVVSCSILRLYIKLDPQSHENPNIAQQLLEKEIRLFANILQTVLQKIIDQYPQVYWGRLDMLGIVRFGSDQARVVYKKYVFKARDLYRNHHSQQRKAANSGSLLVNQRTSQPVQLYVTSNKQRGPSVTHIKPPHLNQNINFWKKAQILDRTASWKEGLTDSMIRALTIRKVSDSQRQSASKKQKKEEEEEEEEEDEEEEDDEEEDEEDEEESIYSSHNRTSAPKKILKELEILKKPSGNIMAAKHQYQEHHNEYNHGSSKDKNHNEGKHFKNQLGYSTDDRVLSRLVDMILTEQDCGCIKKLLSRVKRSWNLRMEGFWRVFRVVQKNREELLSLMKNTSLEMLQENACSNNSERQHEVVLLSDYDSNNTTHQEHAVVKRTHHNTRQYSTSIRGSSKSSKYPFF